MCYQIYRCIRVVRQDCRVRRSAKSPNSSPPPKKTPKLLLPKCRMSRGPGNSAQCARERRRTAPSTVDLTCAKKKKEVMLTLVPGKRAPVDQNRAVNVLPMLAWVCVQSIFVVLFVNEYKCEWLFQFTLTQLSHKLSWDTLQLTLNSNKNKWCKKNVWMEVVSWNWFIHV